MTTDALVRHFTATQLARMQGTQDSAMQDTCVVLTYSSTDDDYGNPVATYTAGASMICGVREMGPREVQASNLVPQIDVQLRLPIDTELDPRDRIRITGRYAEGSIFEEALTAVDYEIVGPVKRGPSGLVVECKKVVQTRDGGD